MGGEAKRLAKIEADKLKGAKCPNCGSLEIVWAQTAPPDLICPKCYLVFEKGTMKTVHKYPLPAHTGQTSILMPKGAQILHVDVQNSTIFLWAFVDDELPATEMREFLVIGTGHAAPKNIDGREHIGTVQMNGVWHIFEVRS